MKLIIDMPEQCYEAVKEIKTINLGRCNYKAVQFQVIKAIQNGTPLEEHCDSCVFYHEESEDEE